MADHIKDLLDKFISKKYKEIVEVKEVEDLIKESINKTKVKHLPGIRVGVKEITIYADSSCEAYQLKLEKNNILKNIQKAKPGIKKIFIKIGEK